MMSNTTVLTYMLVLLSLLALGVGLALLVARAASRKGRSFAGWFWFAFFLLVPAAIAVAFISPPPLPQRPMDDAIWAIRYKRCPSCAEDVLKDAKKCKHCGEMLEPLDSN